MTEKRFTFDSEFEMGIYDRQTNKSYDGRIGHQKQLCELLNELAEENKKLKQEVASENSILWNEILVLRKQGALPSVAFENYLNDLKNKKKLKVILHG